ncbi:MAG: hypothetical protein JXC32_10360 [Anaerolineae bacterium]|nr:hypothetical protein [Anaerolineae bacterium]
MTRKTWSNTEVSAYLDGALTPKNQAALEADIAQDPNLHRRVEELRSVTTMVRAVPLRQPPRNYLLTPSMVAEREPEPRERRRPLWVMRLATSLVAAAFVVTFGLTLLQQGMTPKLATEPREMPQASLMRESAPAGDAAAPEMGARELEAPEVAAVPDTVAVEEQEEPAAEMMLQSTPLPSEDEMAFAPAPESAEPVEAPAEGEEYGIGGGGEPPAEQPVEEMRVPATPEAESSAEMAEEPEMAVMEAEEAVTEDEATEELAAPSLAMEAPGEPEEAAPRMAEGAEKSAADEAWESGEAPGELPVPVPSQEAADRAIRTEQGLGRSVLLGLTIGLGVATVVLTAVTIWLSRRQAG